MRLGSIGASRSALIDHLSALNYPQVLIPVHGDPCFHEMHPEIQQYLEEHLPADQRPTARLLQDPGDYISPIFFDPASSRWRD